MLFSRRSLNSVTNSSESLKRPFRASESKYRFLPAFIKYKSKTETKITNTTVATEEIKKKMSAFIIVSMDTSVARSAKEGIVVSYIHAGGKVGVLLELNCETDFVARNAGFVALANEIALHIAAAAPIYIAREEVPVDVLDNEKQIYAEQIKDKPDKIKDGIIVGKLEKFYELVCLLDQPYVREPEKKIKDLIAEKVGVLGENIQVRRFARFVLGA